MTSKQRLRSFVLVPIDFSYTTSYRLSILTFALASRTQDAPFSHNTFSTDRRQTGDCSINATVLSRSANHAF